MENQNNTATKEEIKGNTSAEGSGAATTEHINLKVVGSDQNEVMFKIKRHTPMKKLMDAYCQRAGKDSKTVRFLYDGVRLTGINTPNELDMEDGDTIDVMVEQLGG